MNDRELLKMAAKALRAEFSPGSSRRRTGPNWEQWEWDGPIGIVLGRRVLYPLTNNGDLFRVASQLKINIDFQDCSTWHRTQSGHLIQEYWGEDFGNIENAILRVAAEIGRSM